MPNKDTNREVTLLLVDVQNDFHPGGSLAIPTADKDAQRIADFIKTHETTLDRIVATMDTHPKLHIAHPGFWNKAGTNNEHPQPFTIISAEDLRQGLWKPREDLTIPVSHLPDPSMFDAPGVYRKDGNLDLRQYCIEYATQLESKGRFQLCIWPEHCLIGSNGHGMVNVVLDAALKWSERTGKSIEWVMKGQNTLSEMYSAMAAEVPITKTTAFQTELQTSLATSTQLLVCGQASSHCVNHTVRDIVSQWTGGEITVLSDCTSAVPGFEAAAETFCSDMKGAGVKWMASTDPNVL